MTEPRIIEATDDAVRDDEAVLRHRLMMRSLHLANGQHVVTIDDAVDIALGGPRREEPTPAEDDR